MLEEFPFLNEWIDITLKEDLGDGDHSSLACIPKDAVGRVKCLYKEDGIVAGIALAEIIFAKVDSQIALELIHKDGDFVDQ